MDTAWFHAPTWTISQFASIIDTPDTYAQWLVTQYDIPISNDPVPNSLDRAAALAYFNSCVVNWQGDAEDLAYLIASKRLVWIRTIACNVLFGCNDNQMRAWLNDSTLAIAQLLCKPKMTRYRNRVLRSAILDVFAKCVPEGKEWEAGLLAERLLTNAEGYVPARLLTRKLDISLKELQTIPRTELPYVAGPTLLNGIEHRAYLRTATFWWLRQQGLSL